MERMLLQVSKFLLLVFLSVSYPVFAEVPSPNPTETPEVTDELKTDESRVLTYDQVTVVASRLPCFKVPFADVPANISYIPANVTRREGEEVHAYHPRDYQGSIEDVEGALFYDQVGNGVDRTFSLRGFSEGSAVVHLLDGVRINEVDGDDVIYPLIDMSDLESIQIDRGSASPIFGSGAFAGVVHLTTRRPSEKRLSLFGGFEFSSNRGIQFYNGFSGTLQDKITPLAGKWTYYFNSSRKLGDGFRSNGEYRITSFNIKTAYELPDDQGNFRFGLKHVDDAVSNPGALPYDLYQINEEMTLKPLDGRDYRMTILQMEANKYFWDHRVLASILASWRVNLAHFYTTSLTFADGAFNPDTDLVTTKSRATDLVWQLAYEDEWGWYHNQTTLGMEFRNASNYGLEQDAFGGNVVENSPRETDRSSDPRNWALYWRQTGEIAQRVTAHVGMRLDQYRLNASDAMMPTQNISRRWDEASWSTGLIIKPLSWTDLYGNYSQGFRVPTISELSPFSGTISTSLRPEVSDSYEVGTRIRLPKEMGLFKCSFFLIDLKDEIVWDSTSVTVNAPFGQNINIGKSRRSGIETRLDVKPVDEISLYGSYTLTDAYVRETDQGGSLIDGRDLGQIPEHRFTWGTTLYPLVRLGEPYDGLKLSLNGIYTGDQHVLAYESTAQATLDATGGAGHQIKAYSVWDFLVSYSWRNFEVYFKVNNVFNNKYYSRAVDATVFPAAWGGATVLPDGTYTFVVPGAPREYQCGVRWEF
ncbi:MAG: TonB-dependent receptor [Candidatus Omnitrophica bacterium]|nr:TonB-dependent receptor [Candidatus Omnitrophota bacterium]